MLKTVQPPDRFEPPPPIGEPATFDWKQRLSLDAIRSHTKTNDITGGTDKQLKLYRSSAIEAAEKYAGLMLVRTTYHHRAHQGPSSPRPDKLTYGHELQYPPADSPVSRAGR